MKALLQRAARTTLSSKSWLRILITIVNVLLVIALAHALAGLTLAFWADPSGTPNTTLPTAAPSRDETSSDPTVDYVAIAAWHLFGQVETKRPVEKPPAPLPVTPLNLRLVGIFFIEYGTDRALALIADGNGPERAYHIGEALPGSAKLEQIQRDHVIVSRQGRQERLHLPKLGDVNSGSASPVPPTMPMSEMPEPMPEPVPFSAMEPPVMDASAAVQRLRGAKESRPRALEEIAFASPYLQGGQFIGFRVRPGRDPQLWQQLGLNSGDVITEVNGNRLSSPSRGISLLREVINADQVSVRVLRNGAEIPLTFSLTGGNR